MSAFPSIFAIFPALFELAVPFCYTMYFFVEKQKELLTKCVKSGRIRKLGVRSEELGVDSASNTPNS
jgi:hypothetical protein